LFIGWTLDSIKGWYLLFNSLGATAGNSIGSTGKQLILLRTQPFQEWRVAKEDSDQEGYYGLGTEIRPAPAIAAPLRARADGQPG
jgi:hypothetical protein